MVRNLFLSLLLASWVLGCTSYPAKMPTPPTLQPAVDPELHAKCEELRAQKAQVETISDKALHDATMNLLEEGEKVCVEYGA